MWDKPIETSVCWENPALISFSCGLMGIAEDDLDPYVVFHIYVVVYLTDENKFTYFFILFGEDFSDLFLKIF